MLILFSGHLTNLNKNYHIVVNQLSNNLTPTRHLRQKFLANSRRIKNATEQLDLAIISICQFLERCSYGVGAYEQRQRNWVLHNGRVNVEPIEEQPQAQVQLPQPEQLPKLIPEVNIPNQPIEERRSTCMLCMVATANDGAAQNIVVQYVILLK